MTEAAESSRFRLDIAYDGGGFFGWSRQPDQRTVQGVLEESLATLVRRSGARPSLSIAGRTDAGVHAVGQVAHVDLEPASIEALSRNQRGQRIPRGLFAAELGRRINGILGASSDVVVTRSSDAPAGFDARFSAMWRRYEYRIADAVAPRDPLQRHRTVWHPASLDVTEMNAVADDLVGLHDYAAYCKPRAEATTIRTVQFFAWTRADDGVITAVVQADAFCRSMVRALVGSCVAVGEGRLGHNRPAEMLGETVRSGDFIIMPAKGLTLMEVGYPADSELAARALLTRAKREL